MTENERYRGVGVALVTPFRDDGEVDLEAFGRHVEFQIDGGTDYLVPCGSTGEAATLTSDEQRRVVAEAVEVSGGRVPVMAGAGAMSTADTVRQACAAREAGADAILAGTPPYMRPPAEGLYAHFRAVAEEGGLPTVVYNVPSRTAANLEPELLLRLAEVENVVGVKEASGELSQVGTLLRDRPEGFLVISGDDELTFPILSMGGDGVISVVANEVPERFGRMVHLALEGRYEEARELHFRLLELVRANFVATNPIPVKAGLAALGRMSDRVRPPLAPLDDAGRRRVEEALTRLTSAGAV